MKVMATQQGYYGFARRKEGDVFDIDSPEHFSQKWMKKPDQDEIMQKRSPGRPRKEAAFVSNTEVI